MCEYVQSSKHFKVGDLVEFLPTSLMRELSGKQLRVSRIEKIQAPDDDVWYRLECKRANSDLIAVDAAERFFTKWQPLVLPAS